MGDEAVVEPVSETVVEPVVEPIVEVPPTNSTDLAAMMNNPLIKAEIAKQTAAAATRAAAAATAKAADDAKKAADRAKMDEVGRLAAEKAESDAALASARAEAVDAAFDRDLYRTLVTNKTELAEAESLDYLKYQVDKIMKNSEAASVADAIDLVLTKHSYLVKKAEAAPVGPAPVVKPTVAAIPPKSSGGAPPPKDETKVKSTMDMTPKEYAAYKKEKGLY